MEDIIIQRIIVKLKILGYDIDDNSIYKIEDIIYTSKLNIITFCNLDKYPLNNLKLNNILVQISTYSFLINEIRFNKTNQGINENDLKSISIGDISMSYGNTSKTDVLPKLNELEDQLEKLKLDLLAFRRLSW